MTNRIIVALVVVLVAFVSMSAGADRGASVGDVLASYGYEMVVVQPGTFTMGSPEDELGRGRDEDQHVVTLTRPFAIGATEVTMRMVEDLVRNRPTEGRMRFRPIPADRVTWYEAIAICNKLSELEGLEPAYIIEGQEVTWDPEAPGYRLPTEAEWEYAARAGEDWLYAGSDDIWKVGWHDELTPDMTHGVARLQPNAWGLYDMSGNVWEWCWDPYGDYPEGQSVDPVQEQPNRYKVARGGSYDSMDPRRLRVADRERFIAWARYDDLGFRLARNVELDP